MHLQRLDGRSKRGDRIELGVAIFGLTAVVGIVMLVVSTEMRDSARQVPPGGVVSDGTPARPQSSTAAPDDPLATRPTTNHLIHELSPYLLQHAHNPVNWYPWSDEALAKARREGKLIFLSIGYSTCYWCHVMERESFVDQEIAQILNRYYIAIKIDREERPDLDAQFMLANELLTGQGGWPNSVWLTPDGKPWMAGSYFPRERFKQILLQLATAWREQRVAVLTQADKLSAAIQQNQRPMAPSVAGGPLDQRIVDHAVEQMRAAFDEQYGGFGRAPKFPPHDRLLLLVHEYQRTGDATLLAMLTRTLDAMARGGIHDQLAGGFHRYSTDRHWGVPHFEKMLYDNAQLLRAFTLGYELTRNEKYRQVVADIAAWLRREMTSPEGAFYSALDAESEQQEGKYYVWTSDEITAVLGARRGTLFARAYGITPAGNMTDPRTGRATGTNVLALTDRLPDIAKQHGGDEGALASDLGDMRAELLAVRSRRERPRRDDKILSGWNGLMIGSLAYAGRCFNEPAYTDAAARAARFVEQHMWDADGSLLHMYRDGRTHLSGYLDDYAYVIAGLLEVYRATDDSRWLDTAQQLTEKMLVRFEDRANGGFYFSGPDQRDLLVRAKTVGNGGNLPSPNAVAAEILLQLSQLTGVDRYRRVADRTRQAFAASMVRSPMAAPRMVLAVARNLDADAPTDRKDAGPIAIRLLASRATISPGEPFQLAVVFDIPAAWHIYAVDADSAVVTPTRVALRPNPVGDAGAWTTPEARIVDDHTIDKKTPTYSGRAVFTAPITLHAGTQSDTLLLSVDVQVQACDDERCLLPADLVLQKSVAVRRGKPDDVLLHPEIFGPQ